MTDRPLDSTPAATSEALLHQIRTKSKPNDISVVLHELYAIPDSETSRAVDTIGTYLPNNEVDTIKWCEQLGLSEIECVLVFSAALRTLRSSNGWIHYNLSDRLYKLFLFGHQDARLPSIIHALCAVSVLKTPNGHVRPFAILAHLLRDVAPREAIEFGLRSGGLPAAAPALRRFGLDLTGPIATLADAEKISTALKFPGSYRHVPLSQAASVRDDVAVDAETARFPRPEGDAEHYIFASAEKLVSRPTIRIHTFTNAEFAIDASAAGVEEHYLYDEKGRCVLEFCHGISPFREPPIRIQQPVAVIDDRFSGAMNICHFLLDHLTRIPLYDRISSGDCLFFAIDDFPYYRQMIDRLGMRDRFVKVPARRVSITAPQILLSSNISRDFRHPAHFCAPWAIEYLRSKLCGAPVRAPSRRWYISRADARGRMVVDVLPVFLPVISLVRR